MTKKDKLTIVPEQAKGRWYHLFVERDGTRAKVIFQHSDDVFYDINTEQGPEQGNVKANHIGVGGSFAYIALPDAPYSGNTLSFYSIDSVEKTAGTNFIPTYKLVNNNYVKQDTGLLFTYDYIDNPALTLTERQGGSQVTLAVKLSTKDFSISNIVGTDAKTEDSGAGGIVATSYVMSDYNHKACNIYITPNVTSIHIWIYGAFTE